MKMSTTNKKNFKIKKALSNKNVRYFKGSLSICTNMKLLHINTNVQPGNIETMISNADLICSIIQTIYIKYKWHNDSLCINTIKYLNVL